MIHGFDVSAYQGTTMPTADFVFVKATEGASYTSAKFAAQWASAQKSTRVRGAYHFARPEQSSALTQADRLISVANPQPGDLLCLDLEASGLSQSATNAWARTFGSRLRERAPGIRTVLYMGSGYASNGTGRGLSQYFDLWWYPQYPSTARTSTWPTVFSPWLPSGLTCGWTRPHIWQFTDNFGGLDANVSLLTINELAGAGEPAQEDTMPYGGQLPAGKGSQVNVSFPKGSMHTVGFVCDNSLELPDVIKAEPQPQIRYAFHRAGGSWQTGTITVGSKDGGKDHGPKQVVSLTNASDVDYASFTRLDDGTRTVGWDMS
jgi:GH25 family lysozyme M1 (1,4-beta-N-acetylmuramidase)